MSTLANDTQQSAPLKRRLARVGGIQLSRTSSLGVWGYANVQGGGRQVTIDVHTDCGFFSLELPLGVVQQLEKLLRAGAGQDSADRAP